MTILRPTGKGQKVGSGPTPENPRLFPKIVGIIIPLISLLNYPTYVLGPLIFWDGPTLPMECMFSHGLLPSWGGPVSVYAICLSPWISLLSLYHGSLFNSFQCKARNKYLAAVPGNYLSPGTWLSSCAPFYFLQQEELRGKGYGVFLEGPKQKKIGLGIGRKLLKLIRDFIIWTVSTPRQGVLYSSGTEHGDIAPVSVRTEKDSSPVWRNVSPSRLRESIWRSPWFPVIENWVDVGKTSISSLLTMTVWITINCGKFFKRWEYQATWPTS